MMHDLIMPKMGESITEATILNWLVKEGEHIEADQPVLEIATDKVDSEVISPVAGIMSKILFSENDVVPVGEVLAHIAQGEESGIVTKNEVHGDLEFVEEEQKEIEIPYVPVHSEMKSTISNEAIAGDRFYSPLVRNIAKEENITADELKAIKGTGAEGRVTKNDILAHIENKKNTVIKIEDKPQSIVSQNALRRVEKQPTVHTTSSINHGAHDEIVEMDRMRRLIADHMVMSKQVAPHVCSFVECDVTNIVMWRNKVKAKFLQENHQSITFTPVFIDACIKAIKEYPMINSSVDGYKIIKRKDINIGMATALTNGNLIVPVIRNADRLNLKGLAVTVNDVATRARESQLKPDEVKEGTFTITNIGSFGNIMGTPIINQPQVAILAIGSIKKRPMVLETDQGDVIGIRHMMYMSLSYDHRIIDGYLGGSFLKRIADILEAFDVNTAI